ncbi:hypothetical protein BD289DRAFT_236526 [Coniella lustricola]|uniref:Zn(2)-C6 fungal-type domain-containing protein n=1 Tax=Coniella lustricola TaxID=2025994 RepID=A0A2T3A9R8_9PEZI|nr:hypothetical protein BD289DRAFT_236526 [Coniella lustricola]
MPPNSGPEQPPKKKQRSAKSCEQCRVRKVRCDHRFPCGPCSRSRGRLTCVYRDIPGDYAGDTRGSSPVAAAGITTAAALTNTPSSTSSLPPRSQNHAVGRAFPGDAKSLKVTGSSRGIGGDGVGGSSASARASSLGYHVPPSSIIDRVGQSATNMNAPTSSSSPRTDLSNYAVGLRQSLEDHFQRVEGRLKRKLPARGDDGDEGSEAVGPDILQLDPTIPRLRFSQDKFRVFGESHSIHTMAKLLTFVKFDTSGPPNLEQHDADAGKAVNELRNVRTAIKEKQQTEALSDLSDRSDFPSRQICEALVASYLRTYQRLYGILDVPEFLEQSLQFWEETLSTPKIFHVKHALVMAIGLPFTALAGSIDQRAGQARKWINGAQLFLSLNEKSTRNIQGLQIFCLLIIARQVNGLRPSHFFSTSAVLSFAMQMGLHRYKQSSPKLSADKAKLVSCLWTTVVELSLSSCLDDGTLPPRGVTESRANPPANLAGTKTADGSASEQPYTWDEQITETSSLQTMLVHSQHLRLQALEIINSLGPRPLYNIIIGLAAKLQTACLEVSTFFASHAAELGPDARFHRRYIDMYLRKHILLLHRPFMLESQRDPRLYLSRKICLETSMIMASYADDVLLPTPLQDDFSSSMVCGRGWLRGGISLDVIVTLAYEVHTQLLEERGTHGGLTTASSYENDEPAQRLARAAREPILLRLKHIQTQLFEIIVAGSPDFKRYIMTCTLLQKLAALEAGQSDKAALFDAVRHYSLKCIAAVRAFGRAGNEMKTTTAEIATGTAINGDETDAAAGMTSQPMAFEEKDLEYMDMDLQYAFDPLMLFDHAFYDYAV